MDLYAELQKNMDEITETFSERMGKYEQELHAATPTPGPQDITKLTREFSDFKSLVWKSLGMLKNSLQLLTLGLDRHETAARRKVLLVHGVQEAAKEEADVILKGVLTDRLKVSAECLRDLKVVHRLGAKGTKSRPLLVRFATHTARNEVWSLKKELRGSGITVSEFLTKSRHGVFIAARKHFGVSNTWTSDGKIHLLLPDGSRQKLECWADLRPLTDKFPSKEAPLPTGIGKKLAAGTTAGSAKGAVTRRQAAQTQIKKK